MKDFEAYTSRPAFTISLRLRHLEDVKYIEREIPGK
jgi:hypothetical protein